MKKAAVSKFWAISVGAIIAAFGLVGCAQNQPNEETQDQGESVEIGGEGAQPDD